MGWTDLDPDGFSDLRIENVETGERGVVHNVPSQWTPDQVANFLADEGLADWVSVDLADWDKD